MHFISRTQYLHGREHSPWFRIAVRFDSIRFYRVLPPRRPRFDCLPRHVSLGTSTLIKKKKKSSYIRKFRWDRVQSHIWGRASLFMRKCADISPYMRRPLVIYDFAPDPSEFPYIWGKFYFLFYQCSLGWRWPYHCGDPRRDLSCLTVNT
jgi:hypothetical protein